MEGIHTTAHLQHGPTVIHCWSGPRCCSTSLMYSFSQRADTQVYDEPLYAAYLERTGLDHPGKEEVLRTCDSNGDAVMQRLQQAPHINPSKPIVYAKQIGKHKLGCSSHVFKTSKQVILVREPAGVLLSWAKVHPPSHQELGYTALLEILSELRSNGQDIIVVLSDELVRNPEGTLRALCAKLGICFDPSMLSWPSGPKSFDGCWSKYWYHGTHSSTGFSKDVQAKEAPDLSALPPEMRPLLAECSALYSLLEPLAMRPTVQEVKQAPESLQGPTMPQQELESSGTHAYKDDPRNKDVFIGIRDGVTGRFQLVWRPHARVSVLDSGYMLGDGVWEGLRLQQGVVLFAAEHLSKLFEGALAIDMNLGMSAQQLLDLVYQTVGANGMSSASGVHIRLMVTRGLKPTPYQSPYITIGGPTIVIIPEYKEASAQPAQQGITLHTCCVRRGCPDVQDPALNSHSKLNCIGACIQAHMAGAHESLMLDPQGFVATCNSVNFFIVRSGMVLAPTGKYQMPGITRRNILRLCVSAEIPCKELDITLTEVYSADEAFVTGTFGGLVPVHKVDGRVLGSARAAFEGCEIPLCPGPITRKLQQLYAELKQEEVQRGRQLGRT